MFEEEKRGYLDSYLVDDQYYMIAHFNKIVGKKSKIVRENKINRDEDLEFLANFVPIFNNSKEAVYGKVDKRKICQAVINQKAFKLGRHDTLNNAIYAAVQCEKDKTDTTVFTYNHLYILILFNSFIGQSLEKLKLSYLRKLTSSRAINLMTSFQEIS